MLMISREDLINKLNLAKAERSLVKFTTGILIILSVLIPKNMYAVTGETLKKFKQTYAQIKEIMESTKTVEGGKIIYQIPDSLQIKINKLMDGAMMSLEEDVRNDIKNQNFGECQRHLEILMNIAHSLGLKNYEKRILEMLQEVHSDFTQHINLIKEGVYTLKNSNKIYCVGKASGRNEGAKRILAELNARAQFARYLNRNEITISLIRPLFYQRDENGDVWVLLEFQGDIITVNGERFTAKELAKKLEEEKRFLSLK